LVSRKQITSLFRLNDVPNFIYLFLKIWYIAHHFIDIVKVRSSFGYYWGIANKSSWVLQQERRRNWICLLYSS